MFPMNKNLKIFTSFNRILFMMSKTININWIHFNLLDPLLLFFPFSSLFSFSYTDPILLNDFFYTGFLFVGEYPVLDILDFFYCLIPSIFPRFSKLLFGFLVTTFSALFVLFVGLLAIDFSLFLSFNSLFSGLFLNSFFLSLWLFAFFFPLLLNVSYYN